MNSDKILRNLYRLGGMYAGVSTGTQLDIMQVPQHMPNGLVQDRSLCDHTCATLVDIPDHDEREAGHPNAIRTVATGGCYLCGSSAAHNKGLAPSGLASLDWMTTWMDLEQSAQNIFHRMFAETSIEKYFREFGISPPAKAALLSSYKNTAANELNIFGGSPGMHSQVLNLVRWSKTRGMRTSLTDTGRQFLTNPAFVQGFFTNPPHVLALSFDDITPDDLNRLFSCSLDEVRELWKQAMRDEPYHGQKHKALEGVYAGRLVYERLVAPNENPPIVVMFNTVIHPGNMGHLKEMVATIARLIPKARLNPYPAQSSFAEKPEERVPCWKPEHLPALELNINWLREQTLEGNPNLTARNQYYLFLQAQMNCFRREPETICARMSGFNGWRPDRRPGAYRYGEISGSGTPWGTTLYNIDKKSVRSDGQKTQAGGHPGSYWYQWAFGGKQMHRYNALELAHAKMNFSFPLIPEQRPNFSGSIMPRLMLNIISTELGMDDEVVPHYLKLRKEDFGY